MPNAARNLSCGHQSKEEERFLVASVVGMTGGGHIDDGACLTKAEKVHDSASPEAEVLPAFLVRYIV